MDDRLNQKQPNLAELERVTTQLPGWISRSTVLLVIAALSAFLVYLLLLPWSEKFAVKLTVVSAPSIERAMPEPLANVWDAKTESSHVAGKLAPDQVFVATGILPTRLRGRVEPGAAVRLELSGLSELRYEPIAAKVHAVSKLLPGGGAQITVVSQELPNGFSRQVAVARAGSPVTGYVTLRERRVIMIIFSGLFDRLGWQV